MNGCLRVLRALGRTVSAELISCDSAYAGSTPRRVLQLKFGPKAMPLSFEVRTTGTHLSGPLASGIIDERKRTAVPWLLCAPYVPGPIGHRLAAEGASYVDAAGNCHIESEGTLIAHVEGKKRVRPSGMRTSGIKSHQLLFALLAQPDLADAPVRKIALAAGIGKSSVLDRVGRWNAQALLDHDPGRGLHSGRVLLERWLTAYVEVVRPSWLVARCQPMVTEPRALEALIERVCDRRVWAFGGTAAASRMLAIDRGVETVLHLAELPSSLLQQLQATAAPNGSLTILHTPGTVAYQGASPHLAHPLLVYSELLTSAEPKARQTASALRREFLADLDPQFDLDGDVPT